LGKAYTYLSIRFWPMIWLLRRTFYSSTGSLLTAYSRALNKHKYTTQFVTGGVLWFCGDLLCQGLVHSGGKRNLDTKNVNSGRPEALLRNSAEFSVDWRRTAQMSIYGMCFSAPAYALWYPFLERFSQKVFAITSLKAPTRMLSATSHATDARLRTWKIIGLKLGMDTVIFDPLYIALFFSANSAMEGKSGPEIVQKLKSDFGSTWLVDAIVWLPIQAANFRFVPVLYQSLTVQACNILWNAYLSFVQHH